MRNIIDGFWNTWDKTSELLLDINDWYKEKVEDFAWKYNFGTYNMSWLGFAEGVLLVLLLQWLF